MGYGAYILVGCAVVAAVLLVSGWWRLAFRAFGIDTAAMTVTPLGLRFTARDDVERIDRILRSFADGFNIMISSPSNKAWKRHAAGLPSLYQPFAHEGAAMGYTLRRLGRCRPRSFERELVHADPANRYLYYVGLGFWAGMRRHAPVRVQRLVAELDALNGHLCFDGYGFKCAFFDLPVNDHALDCLDGFEGYARSAAHQGVGRALWFRQMPEIERLVEAIDALGEFAQEAAAGVGLAAAFVNPDRLDQACRQMERLPAAWHSACHLGLCFGLKARSTTDPLQFDRDLARLDVQRRAAVRLSIEACDAIERSVRRDHLDYQAWRERVARWMQEHIDYPLVGVRDLRVPDVDITTQEAVYLAR